MMHRLSRLVRSFGAATFLIVAGLVAGSVAIAANAVIENAKNACNVGEQADGYLGYPPGASVSDALRREVRDVNQQRKQAYANLASRNGVSTDVAAALTGEKLVKQAKRGQCVRGTDKRWVKL
ncbi:MAG: YdbL family protein [Pseudomonadota bacterium]